MTTTLGTPPTPVGGHDGDDPFLASVVTPEAVLLQFRPAGLGSRMLALVIDLVLQFVVLWILLIGALAGGDGGTASVVVTLVLIFLLTFGYPAISEVLWGRTVGKRALGLRVITTEGGPVRFRHAAIRSLLFLVDFWLPPGGLTGVATVLLTRRAQRLGDLAAGTLVVRSGRATDRTVPVWFAPPPGHESFTDNLDVGRLQPRQYQLVRAFLLRTGELSATARWRVATRLAGGVAEAVGAPPPAGMHPETYLLCVAAAHQRRSGRVERAFPGRAPGGSPPPPTGAPLRGPSAPPPPPGRAAGGAGWSAPPPPSGPPPPPAGGRLAGPSAPPPPHGHGTRLPPPLRHGDAPPPPRRPAAPPPSSPSPGWLPPPPPGPPPAAPPPPPGPPPPAAPPPGSPPTGPPPPPPPVGPRGRR